MKKTLKIILVVLLCLMALTNIPPVSTIFSWKTNDCRYSNFDGSFTYEEMNFEGRNYEACQRVFTEYKKQHPTDTVLYRLCSKSPFRFWSYGNYIFQDRFKLPFANWNDIENRRGHIENRTGFQDF